MKKEIKKLVAAAIENHLKNASPKQLKRVLEKGEVPTQLIDDIKLRLAEQKKLKIEEAKRAIIQEQHEDDLQRCDDDLAEEIDKLRQSMAGYDAQISKHQESLPEYLEKFAQMTSPSSQFLESKWDKRMYPSTEISAVESELPALRKPLAEEVKKKLGILKYNPEYNTHKSLWEKVWVQVYWAVQIRNSDQYIADAISHWKECRMKLADLTLLQKRQTAADNDKEALLSEGCKSNLEQRVSEIESCYQFDTLFPNPTPIYEQLVEQLRLSEPLDPELNKQLEDYDAEVKKNLKFLQQKNRLIQRVENCVSGLDSRFRNKEHRQEITQLLNNVKATTYEDNELEQLKTELQQWQTKHQAVEARIAEFITLQGTLYLAIQNNISELQVRGENNKVRRLQYLCSAMNNYQVDDYTETRVFKGLLTQWKNEVIGNKSNIQVMTSRSGFFCTPRVNDALLLDKYEALIDSQPTLQ